MFAVISPQNSLAFSARICLVTKPEFDDYAKRHGIYKYKGEWTDEFQEPNEHVRCQKRGRTDDARNCVIAAIYSHRGRVSLSHLWSNRLVTPHDLQEATAALHEDVNAMGKTPKRGIILGGWAFKGYQIDWTKGSRLMHIKAKKTLKRLGIPISTIFGRLNHRRPICSSLIVNPARDEIIVSILQEGPGKTYRPILTPRHLLKTFKTVRIANGDVLVTRRRKPFKVVDLENGNTLEIRNGEIPGPFSKARNRIWYIKK